MRRNDKRERLVEAADTLFHKQGVSHTTLAHIAALAEVPLGNVYYYFKTKELIILSVIERRKRTLNTLFQQWDTQPNVRHRLRAFVEYINTLADQSAQFGDTLGTFCQELSKQGGPIGKIASQLLQEVLGWCEKQFKALGKPEEEASQLALNLLASLQGINLITFSFQDPHFVTKQGQYLGQWLETV